MAGGSSVLQQRNPEMFDILVTDFATRREFVKGMQSDFVVLTNNAFLPNERALAGGDGIALADGGAGSTITLDVDISPQPDIGVPAGGDVLLVEDITDGSIKKVTITNVVGGGGGGTHYGILLYDISLTVVGEYDFTEAGLIAAIAASNAGDKIVLSAGTLTLTAVISIPSDVTLAGAGMESTLVTANLNAQDFIALGLRSVLEDMSVNFTSSSALESKAIFLQGSIIRNLIVNKSETGGGSPNWGIEGDLYSSATQQLCSAENIWCYVSETSGLGTNHRGINFDIENPSVGVVIKNITGIVDMVNPNQDGYGIYLDGEAANEFYAYTIFGQAVNTSTGSSVYGIQAGYCHIWDAKGVAKCDDFFANGILIWESYLYTSRGIAYLTAAGANDAYGIDADDCTLIGCKGEAFGAGGGPTLYGIVTSDTVNLFDCIGDGDTADIVGGGAGDNTNLYSVQYDTILDPNGTIIYLQGDRGAYSVEDFHASDIEAVALTRHLPTPGVAGKIAVSDGANWVEGDGSDITGIVHAWTTDANVVNLVTDTDTVTIGSATAGGKLFVDGDADEIQLQLQANSTQTANIVEWQRWTGTIYGGIDPIGRMGVGAAPSVHSFLTINPSGGIEILSGSEGYGMNCIPSWVPDDSNRGKAYFGVNCDFKVFDINATGDIFGGVGGRCRAQSRSTAETVENLIGGDFRTYNYSATTYGDVTLSIAGKFSSVMSGGTWTNHYGVYIAEPTGAGTLTNDYGLYIEGTSKGGTLNYAIYTNDGSVRLGGHLVAPPDEITATDAGVAASITTINTEVTTNGDEDLDNVTLANGVSGQFKSIYCVVAGHANDTWKITPANMIGGTQITFTGVGQGCDLKYADNEGWVVIGINGGIIS